MSRFSTSVSIPVCLSAALASFLCFCVPAAVQAAVVPNSLFSDNVVLQEGQKIPVFGTADNGDRVTVSLGADKAVTTAAGGKWIAYLPPQKAGGPFTLTVSGPSNTVTVNNVLIGEVWICSGQSNMGFNLNSASNGKETIAASADPMLRLFHTPNSTSDAPQSDVHGKWSIAGPANTPGFSAVGYFFGRDLRKALGVPVGMIETDWGGTPAQAWTSADALLKMPDFAAVLPALQAKWQTLPSLAQQQDDWFKANDPGMTGTSDADPALDTTSWIPISLPGSFVQGQVPQAFGVKWIRKSVALPSELTGKDISVHVGNVGADSWSVFVNGTQLAPEKGFVAPADLWKPGANVIAIRINCMYCAGGIFGDSSLFKLSAAGAQDVPISGSWLELTTLTPPKCQSMPTARFSQYDPTTLYNGMVAPLIPFGVKGAIWYQGESNAGNSVQYRTLLATMIDDWRSRWSAGGGASATFPFYIVQLAPFMKVVDGPENGGWPMLREAQRQIALNVPNTGIAVITDVGDPTTVHPTRKEPVGERLSLLAQALTYHQPGVECYGPVYSGMSINGASVTLHFTHCDGGLVMKNGDPIIPEESSTQITGFTMAGADGKYFKATAQITGTNVVVTSQDVPQPKSVRYGWNNYPLVNLYNKAGLPASPFQTDPFPTETR
jgi:sialate O-acetylesterase